MTCTSTDLDALIVDHVALLDWSSGQPRRVEG